MSDDIAGKLSTRDGQLGDIPRILELWRQAEATPSVTDTANDLNRVIAGSATEVVIAEIESAVIGTVMAAFDGWRGNIYRLAVHPAFRRRRIARRLVAEAEKRLLQRGAKRITALVENDHPWAVAFWKSAGYAADLRIIRHVRNLAAETTAVAATPIGTNAFHLVVNERIHVTEVRRSDRAACVAFLNDPEIHQRTLRLPHPYTEASFDEWFAVVERTSAENRQPVLWAIRNEDDSWIGSFGFKDLTVGKSLRAEIGYLLAKPFWGQGIMTDVVRRACEYAFATWGLVKISAEVFVFNPASARVLEKCGFVQEGYLRNQHLKDDRLIDAKLYALITER